MGLGKKKIIRPYSYVLKGVEANFEEKDTSLVVKKETLPTKSIAEKNELTPMAVMIICVVLPAFLFIAFGAVFTIAAGVGSALGYSVGAQIFMRLKK